MADVKTSIIITAVDQTSAALKSIRGQFDSVMAGASAVTGAFSALTGISFAGTSLSLGLIAKSTAEVQDGLGKMAQKAGMSVEAFSGLASAAKGSNVEAEALVASTKTLSARIVEAARAADQGLTVFGGLGIAVKDAGGQFRATDQVLLDVAAKFAGMEGGATKSALAVKLFGKAGLDLIPFLNLGRDGIEALTKEAERMGLVVSTKAAEASEKFNDNLKRLTDSAEGVKRGIGNAALPVLNELVQQLTDNATAADSLTGSIRGLTTQGNLEEWARKGAYGLAFIADGARGVLAIVKDIGGFIGASAAAITEVLKGNFAEAQRINEQWQQDSLALYDFSQARDKVDAWFDDYGRTVRINGQKFLMQNAEQAQAAQKIYDEYYAGLKKKSDQFVEFDEAALKKQDVLRKAYTDEEKRRTTSVYDYEKQKIEEKYAAELAAVRGAQDQANLEMLIKRKMADELMALEGKIAASAVTGEKVALDAARSSALSRVALEVDAAAKVASSWLGANMAKAGGASSSGEDLLAGFRAQFEKPLAGFTDTLSGMATGGSFTVGGSGGTDSQFVGFRATPGEKVIVQTPAQQAAATTVNVYVNGGNPQSVIDAIRQALRLNPNLLTPGFHRPG